MAAGLGFKTFTTGEVLTAADTNGYLMQGVLVFASAATRDAAITSPQEGQFAYLKDTNVTTYYTGSAWTNLDTTGMTNPMTTTGDMVYSSSGSTPARLGIGTTGQVITVAGGIPSWATPSAAASGMTFISRTSFSSVASQAIDSVFSSSYFSYLVVIESIYAATVGDDTQMQMRYGSTTVTSANYNGNLLSTTRDNTTITNTAQSSTNQFTLGLFGGDATESNSYQMTFTRVGNSSQEALWSGTGVLGASPYGSAFFGGSVHNPQTYTGLLLKSSSSNITGAVSVYGLAKA